MKIALLGYGNMGKEIEKIALQRGHEIILKIKGNQEYDISQVDIAIDFSVPSAALNNVITCFKNNIPVISGTTGWLEHYDKAIEVCKKNNGSFIYASNFSIGVNVLFELNKQFSKMMNSLDEYSVNIEETHHTNKLDSPSGTAITLAQGIIENSPKTDWRLTEKNTKTNSKLIPINAKRVQNIPGTHIVSYTSEVDSIEIKHTAKNRKGFALGAIIAAEWLFNKIGIYTMKDVLNIG
jgi:4-hydroxy-tetrahydrodipicolinate reductase|tara:strand:+ start:393 stop:1103 length:711 start_codon:yes stop_codon:yes gene_type:complete